MSLIALLPTDDFSGEDEYEDSEEDEVEFLFKHLTRSECPLRCITGGAVLSRFAFLSLGAPLGFEQSCRGSALAPA